MRIRNKMLLSNMVVGIIPVILAIFIFTYALFNQAEKEAKKSLDVTLQELKSKIDDNMQKFRTYSYFFANSVIEPDADKMSQRSGYSVNISVDKYALKMLEFTVNSNIVRREFTAQRPMGRFLTTKEMAAKMWTFMNKPQNNSGFRMSFPEVIDNTVVMRNVALVNKGDKKFGMSILSEILDQEYLKALAAKYTDLVIFTETPKGGLIFGRPEFNTNTVRNVIKGVQLSKKKDYDIVSLDSKKFYLAKMPLFQTTKFKTLKNGKKVPMGRTTIATIGILYGFESVNKIAGMFRKIALIVFLIGAGFATFMAMIFARTIAIPIMRLKQMSHEFETDFSPIPEPDKIKDEVQMLQKSLYEMAGSIITKTNELNKANEEIQALVEQQNGDYFLTSLLIRPLMTNTVQSEKTSIDFYVNEKKKFSLRKWNEQLGGDICISHNIKLQGKDYIVFVDGDAMGKSMQGAGGALVLGVLFNSIVERTLNSPLYQNKTPEKWVEDLYQELQSVFESFDGSMLMSGIFGLLEEESGKLVYFNAEHPWMVLYRNGRASFMENEEFIGRKIGTVGFAEFFLQTRQVQPGDVIILGSDGRDDVLLGMTEDGGRIINEDETLFLKHVEEGKGELPVIAKQVESMGKLTDDFSLLRIGYRENEKGEEDSSEKIDLIPEVTENISQTESIQTKFSSAVHEFKEGNYEIARDILLGLYNQAEEMRDNFKFLNIFGHVLYKLNENEEALKYWKMAIRIEPDNQSLRHNIQVIQNRQEKA